MGSGLAGLWLWVRLETLRIYVTHRARSCRVGGDALGRLELPDPSTPRLRPRGWKVGVLLNWSRGYHLWWGLSASLALGFSWRLVDAVMKIPRGRVAFRPGRSGSLQPDWCMPSLRCRWYPLRELECCPGFVARVLELIFFVKFFVKIPCSHFPFFLLSFLTKSIV